MAGRGSGQAVARYWRQVRAVQKLTGVSARTARSTVRVLRSTREITSARATLKHPTITKRIARQVLRDEPPPKQPYKDLQDFIDAYEQWDLDFDEFEVETSADY